MQIFHDKGCTEYARGDENTVYVRLNRNFGFGELKDWYAGTDESALQVITPTEEVPNDTYGTVVWVDWSSVEDTVTPYYEGDIISCVRNDEFTPLQNPHVIFYADGTSSAAPQS